MLATSVRERPCSSFALRSSFGRTTLSSPSACSIVIGSASVWDSSPLGPLTVTVWPLMATVTPVGTAIAFRPIRDIVTGLRLPHEGEDFPANASLAGLPVGEQPLGRRDDRYAQAAENARQLVRLRVDPEAGLGDALDAGEAALAVRTELEL